MEMFLFQIRRWAVYSHISKCCEKVEMLIISLFFEKQIFPPVNKYELTCVGFSKNTIVINLNT